MVTLKNLKAGAELAARTADREAYEKGQADVQITVPRAELVARVRAMIAK